MKILSKLMFIALSYVVFNFSSSYATEVFEQGENAMYSQRLRSQFDPSLAKEYIEEEKKASHKQGIEEGIEKGRLEEDKSIALEMIADGVKEEQIAKYTKLTKVQIQELKASLK